MVYIVAPADIEALASESINAAYRVHSYWGHRMSERTYRDSMMIELEDRGLRPKKEVPLTPIYRGRTVGGDVKMDILVADRLVLELKTVPELQYAHRSQLATYLRLANLPLGLLMNFAAPRLKGNIRRVPNADAIPSLANPGGEGAPPFPGPS